MSDSGKFGVFRQANGDTRVDIYDPRGLHVATVTFDPDAYEEFRQAVNDPASDPDFHP